MIRLPQVIAATDPRTVIIREGINDLTHGAATKEVAATLQEMVTAAVPANVILVTLLPTGHIAFTVPSRNQR